MFNPLQDVLKIKQTTKSQSNSYKENLTRKSRKRLRKGIKDLKRQWGGKLISLIKVGVFSQAVSSPVKVWTPVKRTSVRGFASLSLNRSDHRVSNPESIKMQRYKEEKLSRKRSLSSVIALAGIDHELFLYVISLGALCEWIQSF